MSDTPRTDQLEESDFTKIDEEMGAELPAYLRMTEHARELERELAVWKHEVDLLRKELAKADKDLEDNISIFIDLKEQRDRLAEALKWLAGAAMIHRLDAEDEVIQSVNALLAAVKGGKP